MFLTSMLLYMIFKSFGNQFLKSYVLKYIDIGNIKK